MSYRCDGSELARVAVLMMAALVAVVAGLLGSLSGNADTLPFVSDNGHVMGPPPAQIVATPLDPGPWTLLGPTSATALDSIGATNLKYLTAGWTISPDGPRGRIRDPR